MTQPTRAEIEAIRRANESLRTRLVVADRERLRISWDEVADSVDRTHAALAAYDFLMNQPSDDDLRAERDDAIKRADFEKALREDTQVELDKMKAAYDHLAGVLDRLIECEDSSHANLSRQCVVAMYEAAWEAARKARA